MLGCQFGSAGGTASGGLPSDGSGGDDDGSPTGGSGDVGPSDDDTPTSAGDDAPTSGDGPTSDTDDPTAADDDTTGGPPPIGPAPWWDPAWSHRRQLLVVERAEGSLPKGYTVVRGGVETQMLVNRGQLQPNLQDLRIVWWDGATHTELTRRVQRDGGPNHQRLTWKIQAEIDGTSEEEYWLYWGNREAGEPPATWADSMAGTSQVYLAGDDFEDHLTGECPDGWEPCAPVWSVQTLGNGQVLRGISPPIDVLLASLELPADVLVHARVRNENVGACPGLVAHASGEKWIWAGYGCESGGIPTPGVSMQRVQGGTFTTLVGGQAAQAGEWRSVEVARTGDELRLLQDGMLVGSAQVPDLAAGQVGFSVENNVAGDFDDLYVRLYVDPEPVVELGEVELAP